MFSVVRDWLKRLSDVRQLRRELRKANEILEPLNKLRENEGSSVTICADNPDFIGPDCAIEVRDEWTGWKPERFYGDTVSDALYDALDAKQNSATDFF